MTNCTNLEGTLVAFQLGELEGEARAATEQHLLVCPACVGQWLALKRAMENGVASAPSSASRARLRQAVASKVAQPTSLSRGQRWGALAAGLIAVLGAAHVVGSWAQRIEPPLQVGRR